MTWKRIIRGHNLKNGGRALRDMPSNPYIKGLLKLRGLLKDIERTGPFFYVEIIFLKETKHYLQSLVGGHGLRHAHGDGLFVVHYFLI